MRRVGVAAVVGVALGEAPLALAQEDCALVLHQSGTLSAERAFRRAECLAEAGWAIAAREEFTKLSQRLDVETSMIARAQERALRLRPAEPTLVLRIGGAEEEPDVVRVDGIEVADRSLNTPLPISPGRHRVEAWYFNAGARVTSTVDAEHGLYEIELPRLVTTPSSLPDTGEVLLGFGSSLSFLSGLGFFGMLGAYANADTEEEADRLAEALPPLGITFGLTFGIVVTGVALILAPSPPTYSTQPLTPPFGVTPPPPPKVELSVGTFSQVRLRF